MTTPDRFASIAAPRAHDEPFTAQRSTLGWLVERELLRFLKIWRLTVAGQVVSSVLFIVVFGIALGDQIPAKDGVEYKQYIVPGLLIQAIVTVCYINGTATLFTARNEHFFNDVLSSPLRWWELTIGLLSGGAIRGLLTTVGVFLIAIPLTGIGIHDPFILVIGTAGILVAASQVGVIAGAYAQTFDQVYAANTLIVLPLTFLGGVFYSVHDLPSFWSVVSHLNPVFYLVQIYRDAFLGNAEVNVWIALAVVYATAILLSLWAAAIFRTGHRLKP